MRQARSFGKGFVLFLNRGVPKRTLPPAYAVILSEKPRGFSLPLLMLRQNIHQRRGYSTVEKFSEKLTQKGGNCAEIKSVTSDMSAAFLSAVEEKFPNAKHTIDKFHVKQLVLKSLDEVRKKEQKESSEKQALFRGRKLFMIPEKRLTEEQRIALQSLSKQYPKTGRAYRIVSVLDDFYACETAEDAGPVFAGLYSWMRRSRLPEMKNTAATLLKHKDRIMNYFDNRLTNAICEGINSMIQSAKRAARGFHTFKGFASKIFLVAGKLNLAVSCPF